MNLIFPFLQALLGDSVAAWLKMAAGSLGLPSDASPDGGPGLLIPALAGAVAALAVATIFRIYLTRRYRSPRDLVRHGLAAMLGLGLIAFMASDMRHAALAYLGINPAKPAAGFELRLPKAAAFAVAEFDRAGTH